MAKIYKIINTINNKIYIGCTIKSIEERFAEHESRSKIYKYKCKLYNSVKKYGWENFKIEEILDCDESEMFVLEKKYINEYNSFKLGLNSTLGGEGCLGYKHTEESLIKCKEANAKTSEFRKGKSYNEIYSENAQIEIKKRSNGVKKAWTNITEEERAIRGKSLQETAMKKAGYTIDIILDIKKLHNEGMKPRFILKKYPQLKKSDIKNITDKRKWNNLSNE